MTHLFFLTLLAPCVFLFACSCFWVFVVLKINRGRKEMKVNNYCVFTYQEWICKQVFVVLNLFLHQSSASPIAMFLCKYILNLVQDYEGVLEFYWEVHVILIRDISKLQEWMKRSVLVLVLVCNGWGIGNWNWGLIMGCLLLNWSRLITSIQFKFLWFRFQ